MSRPKRIHVEEVAKEAGVSISTVSKVVNNHPDISDRLRIAVREVFAKKGIRPAMARDAYNKETCICVVVELENPYLDMFFSMVVSGMAEYSFSNQIDINLMFFCSKNRFDCKVMKKQIRDKSPDAIVFMLYRQGDEMLKDFVKIGIPVILLPDRSDLAGVVYFDSDSSEGGRLATEHLIALNHRKIAFLARAMTNASDNEQRLAGYTTAMAAAGLAIESRWITPHIPTICGEESGYLQAKCLLAAAPEVTAMITSSDTKAQGVIFACNEKGLRVPEDMSVIGFDDYPASRFLTPPLTSVKQPLQQMGYDVAKTCDLFVRGAIQRCESRVYRPELIVRRSTGVAPMTP